MAFYSQLSALRFWKLLPTLSNSLPTPLGPRAGNSWSGTAFMAVPWAYVGNQPFMKPPLSCPDLGAVCAWGLWQVHRLKHREVSMASSLDSPFPSSALSCHTSPFTQDRRGKGPFYQWYLMYPVIHSSAVCIYFVMRQISQFALSSLGFFLSYLSSPWCGLLLHPL